MSQTDVTIQRGYKVNSVSPGLFTNDLASLCVSTIPAKRGWRRASPRSQSPSANAKKGGFQQSTAAVIWSRDYPGVCNLIAQLTIQVRILAHYVEKLVGKAV
jgi:hypothetical protein